jgi:predicted transcriptional regulator of viral defense system
MTAANYRSQLWDVAAGHYGYVTTSDASAVGVPAGELRRLAARGGLRRIGRGLYRFDALPVTDRDHFMEAVLWVGEGAALSHDAVLALHGLASVNPSTIRVVTPSRVRKTRPRADITILRSDVPTHQLTRYHGIPSTTVARALVDARGLVMATRLREAADVARSEGLLLAEEYAQTMRMLEEGPA